MFQKGDLIVYGNTGICRVEEVGTPESLPGVDKEKLYYKLVPVRSASTIYTPVDTSVFMRPVMTKEAADHLIDRIPEILLSAATRACWQSITAHPCKRMSARISSA